MRKDLENAKAYKIGWKAPDCGDIYFTTKIVKTFEEAVYLLNKWKEEGFQTIIWPVK